LQLQLATPLKAYYLHIKLSVGSLLKAEYLLMISFVAHYMNK